MRLTALHGFALLILAFNKRFEAGGDRETLPLLCRCPAYPQTVFSEVFGGKRRAFDRAGAGHDQRALGTILLDRHKCRAARLGLIAPSSLKRFHMLWREWGAAKIEPGKWGGTEKASRFMALVHRAAAEEAISLSKGALPRGPVTRFISFGVEACSMIIVVHDACALIDLLQVDLVAASVMRRGDPYDDLALLEVEADASALDRDSPGSLSKTIHQRNCPRLRLFKTKGAEGASLEDC